MLITTGGFNCKTLELPWRDNKSNISCIPSGAYHTQIRLSPKYGEIYWVTTVPGRGWILIHSGNFAGDEHFGFRTHVKGCILLGKKFGHLDDQLAVLNSRITVRKFMNTIGRKSFTLNIIGGGSL